MPWDREQYRLEVLEPARRAGNVPPVDLYVRYGLPGHLSDPAAFSVRIADVLAYWRELKTRRTYARLAESLLTSHAELERAGRLTLGQFAEWQADAQREQMERLARLAIAEAGAATHVGPVTVARLRGALAGTVTEEQVRAALRAQNVQVVGQFPELPAVPHPKLASLAQHVQLLGLRLSPEAVFGDAVRSGFRVLSGFRLADGRPLTEREVIDARRRVDALPYSDPAKTPTENVLAILRAAARQPAELDLLLLSEVTERLRQLADSGFVQRAIATQARDLGLDEDEAGLIAAAMLARDTLGSVRQQVEAELADGRLRSAQRLASALPAEDPLREQIAARDAVVAGLGRRADHELASGLVEQAARLLDQATTIASDDARLLERLAALPPPPPRHPAARVDGDNVLITWDPSPALVGRLHYRVMRGQGRAPASPAEGSAVVTQTSRRDVADTEAPPGSELCYSVFATRSGDAWSPPAATQPVMFTPDVTDVSVETAETSVALSWRVHPGTDVVLARRTDGRLPAGTGDGTRIEASLVGLTDTGLRTGTDYCYRITASYRTPGGQRRQSAGIVVPVTPAAEPETVADLAVQVPSGGTAMVAAWLPPRHGQVRLMLSDGPPRWPAGTRVTSADMAGLRQLPGIPRRGADGRDFLELNLPSGRHHIVALTTAGRTVVVGNSAEIGVVEPVRDISALRLGDVVRLSWVWPGGATEAEVRWPGGERRYSRRIYDDEGGVTVRVGRGGTVIEVAAIYAHPGGELTAPAVRTSLAGQGFTMSYRIHRAGPLHPRQRVVEITAEQAGSLPPLVVVRATGRLPPDDPAEGQTVARVEPQPIAPGEPVTVTVNVPRGAAWLACFVDPRTAATAEDVLLFPPAGDEMRIR